MSLLLKGRYAYFLDGQQQNIEEPWELHAHPHSVTLSGQRMIDGHQALRVLARYQRRECTFMHVTWQTDPAQAPTGVSYWHRRNILNWRFDDETESQRLELPDDSLIFPLIRAASGPLIQLLAKGKRQVIVPRLHDPSADDFLHPLLSERRAKPSGDALQWDCFGGEYGDTGARYQLNAQGLTQRYDWQTEQGLWQIKLQDLQQFAYFAGFKRAM